MSETVMFKSEERLKVGDIVQHFKRETLNNPMQLYLYKILAFAEHTESKETLVIYQALYENDMCIDKTDNQTYSITNEVVIW